MQALIPKIIHMIWIGDDSKKPLTNLQSWQKLNPDYEFRLWGNEELKKTKWINQEHINKMLDWEICGVADLMRYEILYQHGGVYFDADSVCLRPLEDFLLHTDNFAAWESELSLPGLVGTSALGASIYSPLYKMLIENIKSQPTVCNNLAWKTTGPLKFTEVWIKSDQPLTIYPSHYFYPNHHSFRNYTGKGLIFADQSWSSTFNKVDKPHLRKFLFS